MVMMNYNFYCPADSEIRKPEKGKEEVLMPAAKIKVEQNPLKKRASLI